MLCVDPHPVLDMVAFVTAWPTALGFESPGWLASLGTLGAVTPFPEFDDTTKVVVRDLLRHGGFKPAGRSKPCSEYIRSAAGKSRFPLINPAVDATNIAALHGCIPVSTVDLDRTSGDLRVGIAAPGSSYVFNPSGQTIDLTGLLCLHDGDGPCANAVKDAQRTKTDAETTRTLTLIWGTIALPGRAAAVCAWHEDLNRRLGGVVTRVEIT